MKALVAFWLILCRGIQSQQERASSSGGRAACGKRGERIVQFMVRRIMGYARAADAEEVQEDGASGNPQAKRHMIRLLAGGVSLTRMPWKAVLRTQCGHLGGCTYTYLQESVGRVPKHFFLCGTAVQNWSRYLPRRPTNFEQRRPRKMLCFERRSESHESNGTCIYNL